MLGSQWRCWGESECHWFWWNLVLALVFIFALLSSISACLSWHRRLTRWGFYSCQPVAASWERASTCCCTLFKVFFNSVWFMCLVPKFVEVNSWLKKKPHKGKVVFFIISGLLIDNPPAVIACLWVCQSSVERSLALRMLGYNKCWDWELLFWVHSLSKSCLSWTFTSKFWEPVDSSF